MTSLCNRKIFVGYSSMLEQRMMVCLDERAVCSDGVLYIVERLGKAERAGKQREGKLAVAEKMRI